MKPIPRTAVVFAAGHVLTASALLSIDYEIPRRNGGGSGAARYDEEAPLLPPPRVSRRDAFGVDTFLYPFPYNSLWIEGSLGSPEVDTLWVPSPQADMIVVRTLDIEKCEETSTNCRTSRVYVPEDSDTFEDLGEKFPGAEESDGVGIVSTESLSIGGVKLENVLMILYPNSTSAAGEGSALLGIGPRSSVLEALVQSGEIPTKAYSWWTEDDVAWEAEELEECGDTLAYFPECAEKPPIGRLLFGGTNRAKYEGDLRRMDMKISRTDPDDSDTSIDWDISVTLHGITVTNSSSEDVNATAALPEPMDIDVFHHFWGSYLPLDVAVKIWDAAGVFYNESDHTVYPRLPCDAAQRNPDFSMKFQLGGACGPVLEFSIEDLMLSSRERPIHDTLPLRFPDPDDPEKEIDWCFCTVFSTEFMRDALEDGSVSAGLSGSMIRKTYIVYDFENKEIAIAKARSSEENDILAFSGLGAKIPDAAKIDATAVPPECRLEEEAEAGIEQDDDDSGAGRVYGGWVAVYGSTVAALLLMLV